MKPLKPTGKIDLGHRALYLQGTPDGSTNISASVSGPVSIVNLKKNEIQVHRHSGKISAVSVHPAKPVFAIVGGMSGSLSIRNMDGTKIAQIQSPHSKVSSARGFADCFFDASGDVLWLAAPVSDRECQVSLVETKGWSVVCRAVVEDRFGQSYFTFYPAGKPGLLALWIAAGQDGQDVYWLKLKGLEFSCDRVKELTNCTPPMFSSDRSEFLVLTEGNSICRYAFPSMTQLGSLCVTIGDNDPFARFGGSICYLDSQHALAATNGQRIFLIDIAKMQIDDELAIEGHEPRPFGESSPALDKQVGLTTDISWFTRLGDIIVFVFRRDRGTDLKGWQDSLLWYSVKK
jgi:hypothetical protein